MIKRLRPNRLTRKQSGHSCFEDFSFMFVIIYRDAEVRPPIPPVRQVLVEEYHGGPYNFRRNNYDNFRNYEQETRK